MSKSLENIMADLESFMQDVKVQGDIQFPIEVTAVESLGGVKRDGRNVGAWVSIRPVDDKKTYLGVYLGDLPLDFFHSYNTKDKKLSIIPHSNPAIYVPDLKRVVWGCESWWGTIDAPEQLEQITDKDIQNIWYIKALKELSEERE